MGAGAGKSRRRLPAASSLVGAQERAEGGLIGRVAGEELKQAVAEVDFPPVLAWDAAGTVRLANQAAADTLGRPLAELIGTALEELASPAEDVHRTVVDVSSGRYAEVHSNRKVHVRGGEDLPVVGASRSVEVDGSLGGVTVFIPITDSPRLGRHPVHTWLDMVPVVVGSVDADWIIEVVSREVEDLLDQDSQEVVGRRLLDLVHPADVELFLGSPDYRGEPRSLPQVRFALPDGSGVEACVVLGPRSEPTKDRRFALVGRLESYFPQQVDRTAELELRLRRIGAEVRAAGLLETSALPGLQYHAELGQLSARQWEILNRLLEGKRVPTIAAELFISRSTVRNHLTTIFRQFEVHSQAELVERLRGPTGQ